MKKNIWKRLISVLCVLSLVVSMYAPGMVTQAETTESETTDTTETSEQITLDDMGLEFIRLSFEDFGITQETKVTSFSEATSKFVCTSSESLTNKWDKTITYGKVKIGASTSNEIHLVNNNWGHRNNGLFLRGTTGGNLSYYFVGGTTNSGTLSSSVVGQSLTETWIDLAISVEMLVKSSSAGSIRVGFFINGELYNNEFITMTNINTDYMGSRAMMIKGSGTNGVSVMPGTLCGEPEYLTLSDLSIADNDNATGIVSGIYSEALFNKKIGMIVNAGDGDYICFMPHTSTYYGGLQIKWDEENNRLHFQPAGLVNLYPTVKNSGVDIFDNTFLLEMYANPVDYDYDGVEDDLVVAFWINGTLWDFGKYQLLGETYSNIIWQDMLVENKRLAIHNSGAAMSVISVPKEQPECDIIDITQADFATNGTQWADKRADSTGEIGTVRSELTSGLLGTKLNVDVMFPESGAAKLLYGATTENDGLSIYADGENLVLYDNVYANAVVATLTPDIAEATLVGERFNLQISYESTFTIATTGVSFDAILGIYINGELYDDEFITLTNVGTELGNGIATEGTETDVVTIWMPLESKEVNPAFTPITVKDFPGLSDNYKNTSSTGAAYKGSLLNKVFSAKMNLKPGNYFNYAAASAYLGMNFKAESNNTISLVWKKTGSEVKNFSSFTSEKAGVDLVNNDILVQLSLQPADFDRDGVEDDVILGVFFDKKLYNNRYMFISEDGKNFPEDWVKTWFAIHGSAAKPIEYYSITDWTQVPYLTTAPADYNIADGDYTEGTSGNLGNSYNEDLNMNGKLLSAEVTFADGGEVKFAGGTDSNSGVKVYRSGEKLYLASVDGILLQETEIDLNSVLLSGADKTFNLKASVEYEERDGSGAVDDVKLGLWINEHFVSGDYFYLYNCAESFGSNIEVENVTIASAAKSMPTDYTEYVFEDYKGLTYILYEEDATGTLDSMVSDEMIFTDKVLIKNDATVELGGYKMAVADGMLSVSAQDEVFMTTDVSGSNTYSFAFVEKRVDADEDGNRDDIALEVYVNGKIFGNKQFFFLDYSAKIDKVCTVTVNNGYVSLKEIYEKAPMPIDLDENETGFVLSTEQSSVVVNAQEVDVATNPSLTTAGDYRITYTDAEENAVTQVVALYHLGDANADNKIDTRDLIAMKKALAEVTELTRAGEYAADLNNDDAVSGKDTPLLRTLLVGEKTAEEIKAENHKTTFGVISDVHLDHAFDHREDNLEKALKYYRKNGVELIIMNGDLSDYGTVASYNDYVDIFTKVYPDEMYWPEIIVTSDNHEYYNAWTWRDGYDGTTYTEMQERFIKYLAEPLNQTSEAGVNTYVTEDGYYFIGISSDTAGSSGTCTYDEETVAFLEEKLQAAEKAAEESGNPDRPIFVAVHQPPTGTVPGTTNPNLVEVFKQYPQVVLFTSHTHTSVKQENNIWQGEYTVVNTSSLYYVGSGGVKYTNKGYPSGNSTYDFGEGLLVNVKDNTVSIQRYDFFNDEEIKEDWVVTTSADGSTLTDYTADRANNRVAPTWGDANIEVTKTSDTTVKLTFASATHEDFVHYYKVKVTSADGTTTKTYRNDFFLGLTRMADTQQLVVDGLTAGTEYTFEVTAVETFGKESEAIATTYTMN